jgi:hypothetical protein
MRPLLNIRICFHMAGECGLLQATQAAIRQTSMAALDVVFVPLPFVFVNLLPARLLKAVLCLIQHVRTGVIAFA